MKNTIKALGIIVILAVIGITMASCDIPQDHTYTFKFINVTDYVSIPGQPISRGPGSVIVKITFDNEVKNVNIPIGGTETVTITRSFTLQEHNDHRFIITASSATADVSKTEAGTNSMHELYVCNGQMLLSDPR
jgi:hypothetical protein